MSKNKNTLLILLVIYIAIVAAISIFHGNNFLQYSDSDGAAQVNYMEFLFFTSVLFQGLMYYMLKTINWKLAILSTIVNLLLSIMFTILIIDWGDLSESTKELVTVYGWCYMVLFSVVAWIQIKLAWD
ncbi:MAG: hypothetical protein WDO14_01640 [Bacteroidota bacterium]